MIMSCTDAFHRRQGRRSAQHGSAEEPKVGANCNTREHQLQHRHAITDLKFSLGSIGFGGILTQRSKYISTNAARWYGYGDQIREHYVTLWLGTTLASHNWAV